MSIDRFNKGEVMKKALVYLIICSTFIISATTTPPDLAVSDNKAPGFYARTLEGKSFFLSDNLGKGRNIFLSFFATWCVPCKQEIPILDSLKNIYSSTDFYLINVSGLEVGGNKIKEDPKKVREFIDMLGVSIPVLMDKYGRTALAYDALMLPTSVMINSEGEIIYNHVGFAKGDEKKISEILAKFEKSEQKQD